MRTPAIWKAPFEVNTTTSGAQVFGQVAGATDGTYYAIWDDFSGGGSVVGRKFDASGNPLSAEVTLASGIVFSGPAVALTADNELHVAYSSAGGDTYVGNYDQDLALQSVTSIETSTLSSNNPAIAAFADGGLFVTYSTPLAIFGQTVSPTGVVGAPITIIQASPRIPDVVGTDFVDHSRLATLDDGNVVVAYFHEFGKTGVSFDIGFQIRQEDGTLVKSGLANPNSHRGSDPDIAALRSGGFVVTFTSTGNIGATVFDPDGNVVRQEFKVTNTTAFNQGLSHVTALDDGGFLISWEDNNANVERAQRFDGNGNAIGGGIVTHTGEVSQTADATLSDGRVVQSFDDRNADSGDYNVFNSILETRTNDVNHVTGANFLGSGTSDLLIVSNTPDPNNAPGGDLTLYGVGSDGAHQIGAFGSDWAVDGAGDTNGDGYSDLFLHNDVGQIRDLYLAQMGPSQITSVTKLGSFGIDWQVAGPGDFNHDGLKDLLIYRDSGGQRTFDTVLLQNGSIQSVVQAAVTPSTWQVDGIGHLNPDANKDDILMHYDDAAGRHLELLQLANGVTQSVVDLGTIGAYYQIDGVGDFNGDGTQDILMHYDTMTVRNLVVANIGNSAIQSFSNLGQVGKNVQIDGIGDFNGDGTADIAYHYDQPALRTDGYLEIHNSIAGASHTLGVTGHNWLVT